MKKNKVALTFIALFTFVGGAFAVANYAHPGNLYSRSSAGVYTLIDTYSTDATNAISTTTQNATYYTWNNSTFVVAKTPGQQIFVVDAD